MRISFKFKDIFGYNPNQYTLTSSQYFIVNKKVDRQVSVDIYKRIHKEMGSVLPIDMLSSLDTVEKSG